MTKVSTKNPYLGNELIVTGGDFGIPEGFNLPKVFILHSAHVRHRGIYLGRRWYLQSEEFGESSEIDLVSFGDDLLGDDCLKTAEDFLAHHGYRYIDYPGSFEYERS